MQQWTDRRRLSRRTLVKLFAGTAALVAVGTATSCAPAAQPSAPAGKAAAPTGQPAAPTSQPAQQAPAQAPQPIKIKFAHGVPANQPMVIYGYNPMMEMVTKETNGRVTWEHYPGEQFGKAADLPDMTKAGTIDMSTYSTGFSAGKFPLVTFVELPGLYSDPVSATRATTEIIDQYLAEGYIKQMGIHPLSAIVGIPSEVISRTPVQKVTDIKGKKVSSSAPVEQEALKLLGAVPVNMFFTERYEALSRGVIDATAGGASSFITLNLGEVAKYLTDGARLSVTAGMIAASEKSWQKWPEDVRKIVAKAALQSTLAFEERAIPDNNAFLEQAKTKFGVVLNVFPPEESKEWSRRIEPVHDQWLRDKEKEGHTKASEILNAYKALLEKYETERGFRKK
ncbi:MAG: TRAP transporter substrate-binding protein DctP [Chloroflexi bacterium]|nr:TRAP transporter substrate-binding protein DctP [Chloroflexota bacterium]